MMMGVPEYDPRIIKNSGINSITTSKITEMLEGYADQYKQAFANATQQKYFNAYLRGLLSNLDRKSIEPIACHFLTPVEVRGMQHFFKRSALHETALRGAYQTKLGETISAPGGMLSIDGSDFVKKGTHSVGVARQYCGRIGKTENCQAGVFISYASEKGYGLVDGRLYIPKCWYGEDYADRREACGIPEGLVFKTKNKIGMELIDQAAGSGTFDVQWIGCDAAFGSDHGLLAALPKGLYYFAGIRENERVYREWPSMEQPEENQPRTGRKRKYPRPTQAPGTVRDIADDEAVPWQKTTLCEGSKGPVTAMTKCLRCVRCDTLTDKQQYLVPIAEVWLYIRRYHNGETKYFFSNAPEEIPMEQLHHASTMRWSIEQCFQECKSYLGMAHYESRTYKGWHRHMLMVMIAHLFILELRLLYKKNPVPDHAYGEIVGGCCG